MVSFNNLYWSSDYKTSIDKFHLESITSLNQIHDVRKLVFTYINYFTNNSEFLDKSSNDLLPSTSPFRTEHSSSLSRRREVSSSIVSSESNSPQPGQKEQKVNMNTAFNNYINHMKFDSVLLIQMASIIDRDVLDEITQFLKFQEPKLKSEVNRLSEIYREYLSSVNKIEKLKSRHQEQLRFKEFNDVKINVEDTTMDDSIEESFEDTTTEEIIPITEEFEFPMKLGTVQVLNMEGLHDILFQLVHSVPLIKRKIPIPGYKADIFSSDSLCGVLSKMRIKGLTPSRISLEKFGQSLLDWGFVTTSQFLSSKKFKSEGMWFEWSDLTIEVLNYNKQESSTSEAISVTSSGSGTKFQTEVAETSKRLNAMFNSVKSSILKTNHDEMLSDIQQKYNQEYLTVEELKYRLEQNINETSEFLESFEKEKIELIYKSLSRLSEILNRFSHKQTETLTHFSQDFLNRINKSVNYSYDLQLLLEKYSTGIYFPSNSLIGQNGTIYSNFQNLKYQFNLYKDIPLQLQVGQVIPDSLLSISSIPYILYQAIKIIESGDFTKSREYWTSPLDYQTIWNIKQDLIILLSEFTPNLTDEISNERLIEGEFITKIIEYLKGRSVQDVVYFVKNWLLEINDSCIPFMVYDSIINNYLKQDNIEELIKQLGSIPRSNLASLIFIIQHICRVFQLNIISNYEISDEIEEEGESEAISEVVTQLNSMNQVGAVPFVHLIMRPSIVKHSTGFKPPIETYGKFLNDLLNIKVNTSLLRKLIDNETNIKRKKIETEKNGLVLKRVSLVVPESEVTEPPTTPKKESNTLVGSTIPKSPRPVSGEFSLRPFRTRATPQPSPRGSPTHSREVSPVRPSSSTLLPPTVKIE